MIARSSARALKGDTRPRSTLGRELGVRYALEGAVRKAGTNLRISVQLIDCETNATVWADKYSGTTADIFDLQEQLSRQIVGALRVTLSPEDSRRLAERPTDDARVYECCAMARQGIYSGTAEGLGRARAQLEEALAVYGRNAPLLASLANVYWCFVNFGFDSDETLVARSAKLAEEALALDPNSANAHFVLAYIELSRGNLRSGMRHARQAHAVEPSNPDVLLIMTAASVALGRDDALDYAKRMADVDPLMPVSHLFLGWAYEHAGQFTESEVTYRRAARLAPGSAPFVLFLGESLVGRGKRDEAMDVFSTMTEGGSHFVELTRGFIHALDGDLAAARAVLTPDVERWAWSDFEYALHVAHMLAAAGDGEGTVRWVTRAVDLGYINYPFLANYDGGLDLVRGRPDFEALLNRVRREWESFEGK